MKKIFTILLLLPAMLHGATYYVSPAGGSDANAGTIAAPWATPQKAFNTADAGDTVFFRGGVWYPTDWLIYNPSDKKGHNGTYGNEIVYINYPGEVPIIDFINQPFTISKAAFDLRNVTYAKFIGLTFRNNKQIVTDQWVSGIQIATCGNIWMINITSSGHGGYGILTLGTDTLYFTNCDSYENYDNLDTDPGNTADGWAINNGGFTADTFRIVYMTGCRAWNNADDGIEWDSPMQIQQYNNWSFGNGRQNGLGNGFKYRATMIKTTSKRKVYNNLSVYNKGFAFGESNQTYELYGPVAEFTNNTAYRCWNGFSNSPVTFNCNTGFAKVIYTNNLVYDSHYSATFDQTYLSICNYQHPNYVSYFTNTWIDKATSPFWLYNSAFSVSGADFTLLPDSTSAITMLSAARQSDGSLPDIGNNFRLAVGSEMKGAGTNVGMSATPDIGIDWESLTPRRKLSPSKNGKWTISKRGNILLSR